MDTSRLTPLPLLALLFAAACAPASSPDPKAADSSAPPAQAASAPAASEPAAAAPQAGDDAPPGDEVMARLQEKWTGDLDGMIERRFIRVATTYNKTNYFIDMG